MKKKLKINFIMILAGSLFLVPSIKGEAEQQVQTNVSAKVKIVKSNLELLWLFPCSDSEKSGLCLGVKQPPGVTLTVLRKEVRPLCKVITTSERVMVPGEDQEEEGFKLKNINCPDDVRYADGYAGKVTDYEMIKFERVTNKNVIAQLDKKMRALKIFKPIYYERTKGEAIKLFDGQPEVYKYPYPNAELYFVRYGYISPLVLFINGKSKVLIENFHLCCEDRDAFRLNNRYYFRASECPEQELPECNPTTYEIVTQR